MIRADLVASKTKNSNVARRDNIEGFFFAVAPVLRFLVFGLAPLALGLVMAFFSMKYTYDISECEFCGFDNFKEVLNDPVFWVQSRCSSQLS